MQNCIKLILLVQIKIGIGNSDFSLEVLAFPRMQVSMHACVFGAIICRKRPGIVFESCLLDAEPIIIGCTKLQTVHRA